MAAGVGALSLSATMNHFESGVYFSTAPKNNTTKNYISIGGKAQGLNSFKVFYDGSNRKFMS